MMKQIEIKSLANIRGGHDKDYSQGHNLGNHIRHGTDTFFRLVERTINLLNPFE